MIECSWFLIYMSLPRCTVTYYTISTPTTNPNKVNIDLETYVDIDEEENDADLKLSIKNQKLMGDVKFIISNDPNLRREYPRTKEKRFTGFIKNAVVTLIKYNDKNLKYFWSIFDNEIRKYHYRNCKFFELTKNPFISKFIANKLKTMKHASADAIRINLSTISNDIEMFDQDESKKKLIDLINSLYTHADTPKFKKFLVNIEIYNIYDGRVINLRKIIREGLRSIVFDHYTHLHKAVREEIKLRIEEYLKPSTYLLAEITNAMLLDVHLSSEKNSKKLTTKFQREKIISNKYNYEDNPTKYKYTKKLKRKMKEIQTHAKFKTERGITKPQLQLDETFTPETTTRTTRFNHFKNQYTTNKQRNKNQQDTRMPKNNKSPEKKKHKYPEFVTDRTKSNAQTSKWYFTQSSPENILRSFFYESAETKKAFKPLEIVTMRPYSPRKTTFFGKFGNIIELDRNTEIPKEVSALRAKVLAPQTKIPGILFKKVNVRNRVFDMKEVTTSSLQENLTSVHPNIHFGIRTALIVKNRNAKFEDESTIGFYRKNIYRLNDSIKKKLIPVPENTIKTQDTVNRFEGTKHFENEYHDNKGTKETKSFLTTTNYIKPITQEKEKNFINVDDYIRRMNTTRNEIKENTKTNLEIGPRYGTKILRRRNYNFDDFIRGKIDPEIQVSEFISKNKVSSTIKRPITDTNFISTRKENKNTYYPNTKTVDSHLHKFSEKPNMDSDILGPKSVANNTKNQSNSNNTVLYTEKEIENIKIKQDNSLKGLDEKFSKSKIVSLRKGGNQRSHYENVNYNNSKDGYNSERKETDEIIDTEPNKREIQLNYNLTKSFAKIESDIEKHQEKETGSLEKSIDKKGVLNYNSRFTIESRKNNTLLLTTNTTYNKNTNLEPNISKEDKLSTNQDIKQTRKSKWSKVKSLVFNSYTDKDINPTDNTYQFDTEQSHNEDFNFDSVKAKKETPSKFDVSRNSLNEKVKQIYKQERGFIEGSPIITQNTIIIFNTISTTDKIHFTENKVTLDPFIRYSQDIDIGTIKPLHPSIEVTASGDLDKLEPIVSKQEEAGMLHEILKRKAQRQVKLDHSTTLANVFGARRHQNEDRSISYKEGHTKAEGGVEDEGKDYQEPTLVPPPPNTNLERNFENY